MSCGFGAVVLLFLIIKHNVDVLEEPPSYDLGAEINLLQTEIGTAQSRLAEAKTRDAEITEAHKRSRENLARAQDAYTAAQQASKPDPKPVEVSARDIDQLREKLRAMENEKEALQAQVNKRSKNLRTFTGAGNRQYLTGLKLGGKRVVILLDVSASMLDASIVNIIRRRNMDDASKRRSEKWQQALSTVDWITARFVPESRYQIITFNTAAKPALSGSEKRWLKTSDVTQLDDIVTDLRRRVPQGGSNLAQAFLALKKLSPPPDNVFLITDGLPTQGLKKAHRSTVSGKQRLRLFDEAIRQIKPGYPINVILLPMEGDPMAASAFWQIALFTRGAFLTPSYDWP